MWRLSTIRSAMRRRMIDIGSISNAIAFSERLRARFGFGGGGRSRRLAGARGGAAGAGSRDSIAGAAGFFAAAPRFSMKLRMSCLVTRPLMPVPSILRYIDAVFLGDLANERR